MTRDPDPITILVETFVHLTPEEIEGYLTQSLDERARGVVEEHLESCPRCAGELRLIWKNLSEETRDFNDHHEPSHPTGSGSLLRRLWIKAVGAKSQDNRIVMPLPAQRAAYTRLWIGQRYFKLWSVGGPYCLLAVAGLSISTLLIARAQERRNPGSNPLAIEGPGKTHILAFLNSFRPTKNFKAQEMDLSEPFESEAPPLPKLKELHILSKKPSQQPVYESMSSVAPQRTLTPGRFASIEASEAEQKPELILLWRGENVTVEILKGPREEQFFLRIREKVNPVRDTCH